MSIEVRNNMHFVLYRYCWKGRYSLEMSRKSGNLIMTIDRVPTPGKSSKVLDFFL